MALLDDSARKRIEAAIGEIEQRTAAEFVVVSVGRSDSYLDVRLGSALALALLGGACVHLVWPELAGVWLLWLQLGLCGLALLLLRIPPLLRLATPPALASRAVERRAREAFLARNVFATRDRTGVLILLSELERRVVIMGDEGIHARVKEQGWQGHVAHIVRAIREGRAAQGVCEVLAKLGALLAGEVPIKPDDENELRNTVTSTPT